MKYDFSRFTATYEDEKIDKNWNQVLGDALEDDFTDSTHAFNSDSSEYLNSFRDVSYNSSHLDSIREEYERKQHRAYANRQAQNREKLKKKAEAPEEQVPLFDRLFTKPKAVVVDSTMSNLISHQKLWKIFVKENEAIRTFDDVPMPMVLTRMDTEKLASYIKPETFNIFKQLQIDFHPDRFNSRFKSRIEEPDLYRKIFETVVKISQVINSALSLYNK